MSDILKKAELLRAIQQLRISYCSGYLSVVVSPLNALEHQISTGEFDAQPGIGVTESQSLINSLRGTIDTLIRVRDRQQSTIAGMEREITRLQNALDTKMSEDHGTDGVWDRLHKKQSRIDQLERYLAAKSEEVANLADKNSKLAEELARANAYRDKVCEAFRITIKNHCESLKRLDAENTMLERMILTKDTGIEQRQRDIVDLRNQCVEKDAIIRGHVLTISALKNKSDGPNHSQYPTPKLIRYFQPKECLNLGDEVVPGIGLPYRPVLTHNGRIIGIIDAECPDGFLKSISSKPGSNSEGDYLYVRVDPLLKLIEARKQSGRKGALTDEEFQALSKAIWECFGLGLK